MNELLSMYVAEMTHDELTQAVLLLAQHLNVELYRVPVEKSCVGQTEIELRKINHED